MEKFRIRDALQSGPMFCMRKNPDSCPDNEAIELKKIIFFIQLSTSVVVSVADSGCFSPQKRTSSTSKDEM
jgi:hypothetical protein